MMSHNNSYRILSRGAGSKLGVGGLIQAQAQDNTVIYLIVVQPWPSVKLRSLEGPFYFHLNLIEYRI